MLESAMDRIKYLEGQLFLRDQRIKELESKATSKNTSLPPSKDITKSSNKYSLRKKSGKKSGGQQGHKGNSLPFSSTPDMVIDHKVMICQHCESDLSNMNQKVTDRQQVRDIPRIDFHTIEHVQYSVICPVCQHTNKANLPFEPVKSKVQYGKEISNLVNYLSVRQCLPMARLREFLNVKYNLKISDGTINNMLNRKAKEMEDVHGKIKMILSQSKTVGSDETGINLNGKTNWMWVYQNDSYTYFYNSKNRGFKTIEQIFPAGLPKSVLITDRWGAQLKTKAREHQICLQHLKRDCKKLIEVYQSKWAMKLSNLIDKIIDLSKLKKIPLIEKQKVEQSLTKLLQSPLSKSPPKVKTLKDSLSKLQRALTTCLYERYVQPTNNSSEQAIRKIKIKEKISGCFRSEQGLNSYALITSIIDSAIKQNIHPFEAILNPNLVVAK